MKGSYHISGKVLSGLVHLRNTLTGTDSINYINGPETLPPPLKGAEEAKVMERIEKGDEKAREVLITHNLRLVNIKLATYASRCIENEILMYLRKTAQQKNEISIDEPLNVDWDGNELLISDILGSDADIVNQRIEQESEQIQLMKAVMKLNKRELSIMELRFGLNGKKAHTQKQVADMLGISQSYISRLEKKIISRLKSDMEADI